MTILYALGYFVMAVSAAFAFMVIRYRQINRKDYTSDYMRKSDKAEAKVLGALAGAFWPFTLPIAGPIYAIYLIVMKLSEVAEKVAKSKP